jgi:hypothetical protein
VGNRGVTVDRPPPEWIAKYQDGWNKTTMKRGKRKSDSIQSTVELAPPPAIQPQAPVINYNMAPAPPAPVQSRFSYSYGNSHPYARQAYAYPRRTHQIDRQRAPMPSSPIRGVDNKEALAKYKDFLLQDESDPPRRQAIESSMDVVHAQFLDDLEILKLPATVETLEKHRVPSGIAMLIVKKVSEFKRVYNGQTELMAAQGLLGMGESRSTIDQPNRQPSFQSALQYTHQSEGYHIREDDPIWDEEMDYFDDC